MEKWNKNGAFVLFKHSNEIRQILHTDNNVIWFTDNSYMYPLDYHLIEPITLKQINELLNRLNEIKKLCVGNF